MPTYIQHPKDPRMFYYKARTIRVKYMNCNHNIKEYKIKFPDFILIKLLDTLCILGIKNGEWVTPILPNSWTDGRMCMELFEYEDPLTDLEMKPFNRDLSLYLNNDYHGSGRLAVRKALQKTVWKAGRAVIKIWSNYYEIDYKKLLQLRKAGSLWQ